ncbi:hypothetical protein [uncultured Comamonas sp.]|uniref:hypothetical protein n=1 Tax=uncultured Comamonas sp. TaxID=114710 RepID=UPI003749558A
MSKISNVISLFRGKNVAAKYEGEEESSSSEAWQISLPFNAPPMVFVIHSEVLALNVDFKAFIEAIEPVAIFDMRKAPRLDFISSNRVNSFALLDSMHVKYFDVLGRTGFSSSRASEFELSVFIGDICSRAESIGGDNHPMIMLFDDSDFYHRCERALVKNFDLENVSKNSLAEFSHGDSKLRM